MIDSLLSIRGCDIFMKRLVALLVVKLATTYRLISTCEVPSKIVASVVEAAATTALIVD